MPPVPRPQTHLHKQNETLPYNRPPSSSSSTSNKTKVQKASPRPDTPSTTISEVDGLVQNSEKKLKKSKRKKSKHHEKSASTADSIDGSKPAALTSTIMPGVDNQAAVLARYMSMTVPRAGNTKPIHTPSTKKADSPIQRPPSVKPMPPPVTKDDKKVEMLQKQLARAKEGAERIAAEMKDKVEGLEKEIEAAKTQLAEQNKIVEEGTKMKDALKEAVGCGVCFETLRDPHILSCGHIACKGCLVSWFRTPGAYVHEIHEALTPELNTSYRSKVCHVCRSVVVRRPARVYHLRGILEPLGIDSELPTASQEDLERDDPWRNIFPAEKTAYRLHDEIDGVSRCPDCFGEIEESMCGACAIEFSETESDGDEGDWESEDGSLGSILDGEEVLTDLDGSEDEGRHRQLRSPPMRVLNFAPPARYRLNRQETAPRPVQPLPQRANQPVREFLGYETPARYRRLDREREEREREIHEANPRPVQPLPARANQPGLHQLLDDAADESDGFAGEHDYPDAEESDEDGSDDEYGGSFIDDGELSGGEDDGDGTGDGGSDEMEVDADVVLSEKEEGASEEDDPPIEELRRRRVQRHVPVAAVPAEEGRDSPAIRRGNRRRHRAVVNLNSDEE